MIASFIEYVFALLLTFMGFFFMCLLISTVGCLLYGFALLVGAGYEIFFKKQI